jgi:hypothetical protein
VDLTCVTVDCADPAVLAMFWNEALGWGGVAVAEDGSGAICGRRGGGAYLEFMRVPEGKVVKNRLHLGCSAGSLEELEAELAACWPSAPPWRGRSRSRPPSPPATATSSCGTRKGTSSASGAAGSRPSPACG